MKTLASLLVLVCFALPVRAQMPDVALPKLDGSTSTSFLGQLLWGRANGFPVELRRGPGWQWASSGEILPTFPVQTPTAQIRRFFREIQERPFTGTSKAYGHLASGQRDLILVARPPSKSELAAAQKTSVEFELRPIARDGLVFLVNEKNPVQDLSRSQLRDIFTGKTRLWRVLGGRDFPILALTRNENSGSQELFDALLLPDQKPMPPEPNTREDSMGAIIDRVAQNPDALGYSVFYYEKFMAPREKNRVLKIDGIEPNAQTLHDGSYPFTAPVYVVCRAGLPADSPTLRWRDWLLSPEGQKLVEESGYVGALMSDHARQTRK